MKRIYNTYLRYSNPRFKRNLGLVTGISVIAGLFAFLKVGSFLPAIEFSGVILVFGSLLVIMDEFPLDQKNTA